MNLETSLCLGGNEVGNGLRTITYIREACLPVSLWFNDDCPCLALEDEAPFVSPEADPAPWYVAANPESGEFLGVLLDRMTLAPVVTRSVVPKNSGGGVVGRMIARPRTLDVTGWMFASSCAGMAWGQRWLADVLNGSCGGCADDTAEILPNCPDTDEYDPERFFRTLHKVGMTEGPSFTSGADACYLQEVSFTLVAGEPYLFAPATACISEELSEGESTCCLVSTEEWNGDATLVITLEGSGTPAEAEMGGGYGVGSYGTVVYGDDGFATREAETLGVTVTLTPTFDGLCPAGPQMPCASWSVPVIAPGDKLRIDGVNREVSLYDATSKSWVAGLGQVSFDGMFGYPDIAPCSQACVCVTLTGAYSGNLTVTVEQFNREY